MPNVVYILDILKFKPYKYISLYVISFIAI